MYPANIKIMQRVAIVSMKATWILFAAILIAQEHSVSARVCVLGTVADGGRVRFALPPGDPCSCTQFMVGGHNTYTFPSKDYHVIDVAPMDDESLRRLFGCEESSSTKAGYTSNTSTSVTPTAGVQTTFEPPLPYKDCQEILDAGHQTSGVYTILQSGKNLKLYCDMDSNGEGYIVIQRRTDGSVTFNRSWAEYQDGFGNLEGDFWWGNKNLRRLTDVAGGGSTWKLKLTLRAFDGDVTRLQYGQFKVKGENYDLNVNGYEDLTGGKENAGDSLEQTSFSTYDRDNDHDNDNCADLLEGGWWFKRCADVRSNLNGEYSDNPDALKKGWGLVWKSWRVSLLGSEMKIQRN